MSNPGPLPIILLVAAGLAVIIVIAVLSHRAHQKRRDELAALAAELGLSFDPSRDTTHDEEYAHFKLFRRGHSRSAYNTLSGAISIDSRSFPCKMGDFTYSVTRSTGKSTTTTTYRFSYLILHLPFPQLPSLLIRREGMFDKLAGALGFEDIDFESAEFSRRFHVKSNDKRFAYDIIHPRMMEFLLASFGPAVDIERARCCLTDGATRWTPAQFKSMLTWLQSFFDLWPDHLTASLESHTTNNR